MNKILLDKEKIINLNIVEDSICNVNHYEILDEINIMQQIKFQLKTNSKSLYNIKINNLSSKFCSKKYKEK